MAKKGSIKDIITSEYAKCAADPRYFMRKYCFVQHPKRGKVRFDLYPFQEETLIDFAKHRFNIILKSRQLGISTLTAAYSLWRMTFRSDYNVLVIATKQEVAKNLVTKVRVMYDNLPKWLKADSAEHNKLSLRFTNGSQIKAVSASGDAGRSEALSLLVIDEAAFIKGIDEIWAAAQSTLSTGGDAVILSTPNGTGNFFHRKWVEATNEGTMNPIELHWTVHPERDQNWREEQTALLGEKMAAQECDCDFIASGHSVIPGATIKWYEDTHVKEPLEKRGAAGDYWIWDYPIPNKDYIVTADVSRGDGKDYSAFHVFEVENMIQVAEFKGKVGTTEFGNMLIAVATDYNDALLAIENANLGWAVVQIALDRGYKNIYYSMKNDHYVDEHLHIAKQYDMVDKSKLVPGFTTSTRTRPLMIGKMEQYLRERTPIINSKRTIDELYVFIWNGSKPEAQSGYNDDLIMSFCIALWVRDTALRLRQMGIELTRKALKHIDKPVYVSTDKKKVPGWTMRVGRENVDLNWLR